MGNPGGQLRYVGYWLGLTLLWVGTQACTALESMEPTNPPSIAPTSTAEMPQIVDSSGEREALLAEFAQVDVVYLGETHASPEHHQAQLEIVQALYQTYQAKLASGECGDRPVVPCGGLAIALEMFQRPFQPALDAYLAGEIDEAALREATEYDQRWGYPWEYYAPILRFAQAHQIPVLALNTPTEVTQKVARTGLASLTAEDFRYIPPLAEIRTDNDAYRQALAQLFDQSHSDHGHSLDFENFFAAQVLWDETMADGLATFLDQNPQAQVVVLTGQGHVVFGYGIPDRVARRQGADLAQRVLLFADPTSLTELNQAGIADVIWQTGDSW